MLSLRPTFLTATLAFAAAASPAFAADMVGDTLVFLRAFPTPTTPFWANSTKTTTVAVGTSDLIDWFAGPGNTDFHLTVNPEATTITFSLLSASSFLSSSFDGFVISGFSNALLAVTVGSNTTGLTIAPTISSPTSFRIALSGSNSIGAFVLNVSQVPEPAPAALLLGGLAAMGWRLRKR